MLNVQEHLYKQVDTMNEYLSYELHKQVLPEVSPVMTMQLSSYYINYSTKISRRKTLQVACGKNKNDQGSKY